MCDWTGCGHTESLNVVCLHKIFIVCFFWFWPNLGGFWLVTEQTGLLAIFPVKCIWAGASQVTLVVKNPPSNVGDIRDSGLIPGSGRSSGGGHGNSLWYSCLENPWTEVSGGLWSIGLQRVEHDWSDWAHTREAWHMVDCQMFVVKCEWMNLQSQTPSLLNAFPDSQAKDTYSVHLFHCIYNLE